MHIRKFLLISVILILCISLIGCSTIPSKIVSCRTEVHFSPGGHTRDKLIEIIDNTRKTIDIAIFDFTSEEIKYSLEKAKDRGVRIRIIADSRQYKGPHSVVQSLIDSGFDVKIMHGKGRGVMHNKFAIFDKILLFTGSYNWTDNAEYFNYENAIFISSPSIITQYQKEFNNLWNVD
jgi:phosphatidylserine/phosphatidylglycerophosphate/cardiolipin synthase-like enzyme